MKKLLVTTVIILGIGLGGLALAQYGGYWGHMMGRGYGTHMMGWGPGGYCWNAPGTYERTGTVTETDVQSIMSAQIAGNPNLRLGQVRDEGTYFEAEITTKDGSLIEKLAIDKGTGLIRPLY